MNTKRGYDDFALSTPRGGRRHVAPVYPVVFNWAGLYFITLRGMLELQLTRFPSFCFFERTYSVLSSGTALGYLSGIHE